MTVHGSLTGSPACVGSRMSMQRVQKDAILTAGSRQKLPSMAVQAQEGVAGVNEAIFTPQCAAVRTVRSGSRPAAVVSPGRVFTDTQDLFSKLSWLRAAVNA